MQIPNLQAEVVECFPIIGDGDYFLRLVVLDIAAFKRFVLDRLSGSSVAWVRSSFGLKQAKYRPGCRFEASLGALAASARDLHASPNVDWY